VDENLDAGPILAQASCPCATDTTAEALPRRILARRNRIYTDAVALILRDGIESRAGCDCTPKSIMTFTYDDQS